MLICDIVCGVHGFILMPLLMHASTLLYLLQDKLRKKKKIKAIKSKNRIIEKAQVQTASQHSWQKFVKKSEKKHLAGTSALVNNSHHSGGASGAFAPSSSGGGKPMTVFQERTKHSKYGGAAGGMGSLGDDDDDDDA